MNETDNLLQVNLFSEKQALRLFNSLRSELKTALQEINQKIDALSSRIESSGNPSKEFDLLTYEQVMQIFQLKDRSSLYRRIKKGELRQINIGSRVYFKESEVRSLIDSRHTGSRPN